MTPTASTKTTDATPDEELASSGAAPQPAGFFETIATALDQMGEILSSDYATRRMYSHLADEVAETLRLPVAILLGALALLGTLMVGTLMVLVTVEMVRITFGG